MSANGLWPNGMTKVDKTTRRFGQVTARDIERFTKMRGDRVFLSVSGWFEVPVGPGDSITAKVEFRNVRPDKPITQLQPRVIRDDGTVVLDGDAVCYTMPTWLRTIST